MYSLSQGLGDLGYSGDMCVSTSRSLLVLLSQLLVPHLLVVFPPKKRVSGTPGQSKARACRPQ